MTDFFKTSTNSGLQTENNSSLRFLNYTLSSEDNDVSYNKTK